MSILYTGSINYSVSPPTMVSGVDYNTSSIVYDPISEQYIEGSSEQILTQDISSYQYISVYIAVKNTKKDSRLQYISTSTGNIQQNYVRDLFQQPVRFNWFSSANITKYTKQILRNFFSNVRLQRTNAVKLPEFSRQVSARFTVEARMQRIEFLWKERDRLIWHMRSTDKNTNKYFYWSTENVYQRPSSAVAVIGSTEILSSIYVTGSNIDTKYGQIYEFQDPLIIGPSGSYNTESISSPINGAYLTGTISSSGVSLPEKEIYLQKIQMQNQDKYKFVWHNRGNQQNNNNYTYWRGPQIATKDTTYNTTEDSREVLSSNHEK